MVLPASFMLWPQEITECIWPVAIMEQFNISSFMRQKKKSSLLEGSLGNQIGNPKKT